MALNFPGLFPPGRTLNVNYDWVDLASGTGYVLYDGFNAYDTGGNNYKLIESTKAATIVGSVGASATAIEGYPLNSVVTGNSGQSFDQDFDLTEFKFPQTIEGEAFVKIGIGAQAAEINSLVITARLRKWDGSSETEIANKASDSGTVTANDELTRTLAITVPKTHFKKGEILRLTILISTGDNDVYEVGHNPRDTAIGTFAGSNSRLVVAIPYQINT
jgi:hypothetical protein|tara:strand:+ start:514 stop:1167 length:654 start_codon:yes stop_codon:yes gene_type:complete